MSDYPYPVGRDAKYLYRHERTQLLLLALTLMMQYPPWVDPGRGWGLLLGLQPPNGFSN